MSDQIWLVFVCTLEAFVSLGFGFEVFCSRDVSSNDTEIANNSVGWQARWMFHVVLGLANSMRAICTFAELYLDGPDMDLCDGPTCWVIGLLHGVPGLLFFTTFGLVTVFWAQLYYATWGISYATLRPGFITTMLALYVTYFVIAVVSLANKDYRNVFVQPCYLMGCSYMVALFGMIYYGINVIIQLRPQSKYSESYPARKMILMRLIVLCILCSVVMSVHMGYCFIAVTKWHNNTIPGYPDTDNFGRAKFEAVHCFFLEFIPSVIILALTRQQSIKSIVQTNSVGADSAQASNHVLLTADEDEDFYQPMVVSATTHTVGHGGESLTTQLLRSDHELEEQSRNFVF